MNNNEIEIVIPKGQAEIVPIMQRTLMSVREELRDDPYIIEAIKVLQVGGYRSSIGSFWNAVVDDLRNNVLLSDKFSAALQICRRARCSTAKEYRD